MKKSKRLVESSAGGHIDVAYGIYDRPGPDITNEVLPEFDPIVPKEQVSTQLSTDRPPVDDPEYVPTSQRSFEIAMSTLASYVPEDQIEKLYTLVRDKIESMVDDEMLKSRYAGAEVMESVKKRIRKMVLEQFRDEDLKQMQADFEEEFGDEEEAMAEPPAAGEASLEQIAAATGFAGPSGVKNFLYRLLSRMARFESVPADEVDALIDFAAGEYVDVLQQADLIDEEDAEYMVKNKDHVTELPSFRFFVAKAIAEPALKELERSGRKKATDFLNRLKISDRTINTLLNQLTGKVPRNDDLVASRIDDDVAKGTLTAAAGEDAKEKIASGFEAMKKLVMTGDDFVETALQKYSKLSKAKLVDIVKKAAADPYVAEKM
jgi:hypothetical protein